MGITRRGLSDGAGAIKRFAQEAQVRVAEAFAEYIRADLRKQHETGRNIYGQRFPKPKNGGAPMLDTGLLMDGYDIQVVAKGRRVRVGNHVFYSEILNEDGKHQHLLGQIAPKKWQEKLEKIKKAELRIFFREVKAALRLKGKAPR